MRSPRVTAPPSRAHVALTRLRTGSDASYHPPRSIARRPSLDFTLQRGTRLPPVMKSVYALDPFDWQTPGGERRAGRAPLLEECATDPLHIDSRRAPLLPAGKRPPSVRLDHGVLFPTARSRPRRSWASFAIRAAGMTRKAWIVRKRLRLFALSPCSPRDDAT